MLGRMRALLLAGVTAAATPALMQHFGWRLWQLVALGVWLTTDALIWLVSCVLRQRRPAQQPHQQKRTAGLSRAGSSSDWGSSTLFSAPPVSRVVIAPDGCQLHVLDFEAEAEDGCTRGVVVCGHAMFVNSTTLARADRDCVTATLVKRGLRVLAVDLRGRRRSVAPQRSSGEGATEGVDITHDYSERNPCYHRPQDSEGRPVFTYEQSVADVSLFIQLARELQPGAPVYLLGHSIFSHLFLAHLGQVPKEEQPDGIVALASGVWLPKLMNWKMWWRCFMSMTVMRVLSSWHHSFPAKFLGLGSEDEKSALAKDIAHFWKQDEWQSPSDGSVCFRDNLRNIKCPMLLVFSCEDTTIPVDYAERFFSPVLQDSQHHLVVMEGDRDLHTPASPSVATEPSSLVSVLMLEDSARCPASLRQTRRFPGHMELTTSPKTAPVWEHVAQWLVQRGPPHHENPRPHRQQEKRKESPQSRPINP